MVSDSIDLPVRPATRIFSPLAVATLCVSENKNQHVCHRVQRLSSKFQGFECGQHLDFKFLVMHIQRVKVLRRTTALGSTHCGQYRFDHLLAKDQQCRELPCWKRMAPSY